MMKSTSTKLVSINELIEFGKCEALNAQNSDDIKSVFGFGGCIKSNKDEPEIIISITFREKVNIVGLMIETFGDDTKPSDVQLFSNKTNIGFSDIGVVPATESITSFSVGKQYPLKLAKYRGIDTLTLYISNSTNEIIEINNIQIYGQGAENTDMSQMKNTNP